jgi:hypothetical protein
MGRWVPTVLTLSLACCLGKTTELGLRATLTFHETMCSVVLCEIEGGVDLGPVEDANMVVHQEMMVARHAAWGRICLCASGES